ncbi:DUF6682 family protein [Leclercia sp.]|uniref:phage adaptor protein n=1 Tax=Leclercia sp. TaxID=1898428 RepID=UPI0028BE3950|nr:DUF6682 family protein [Leclercia sp.]
MKTAKELLDRAGVLLLDEGYVRWDLPELLKWLNDGLLSIVTQKPSATAVTVTLPLAEGTLQSIPAKYNSIMRVIRNVRGENSDRLARKIITVVGVDTLDAVNPAWHDPDSVRYAQQAKHIIFDEANPRAFYVYPGNDGNGYIEAVLSAIPAPVTIADGADADNLDSYDIPLTINEIYTNALLYFVLHRAYAKDAQVAGAAARSAAWYQQYANELGIQVTVETNMSPNVKSGVGRGAVGVTQQ